MTLRRVRDGAQIALTIIDVYSSAGVVLALQWVSLAIVWASRVLVNTITCWQQRLTIRTQNAVILLNLYAKRGRWS